MIWLRRLILLAAASSIPLAAQPLIATVAGADFVFHGDGLPALNAPIGNVAGVAVDAAGNLYFVDQSNFLVMKMTPDGILHVIAGTGIPGFSGDGGPATSASINSGGGIAVDPSGNVYLADTLNSRVRMISTGGTITTVAGSRTCVDSSAVAACQGGDGGPAVAALLNTPFAVKLDSAGNLYIVDYAANRVRKVSPSGVISTYGGNGDDSGSGDGGLATRASLISPLDAAFDSRGNLWILQRGKISVVGPTGIIAGVTLPDDFRGLAIDAADAFYLADWVDEQVLKLTLSGDTSVVAGLGAPGFSGDGGPATQAQLTLGVFSLAGLAIDPAGNLFIADIDNFRIREVTPDGIIRTVAGSGQYGYSGDGGPAIQATFNRPSGVVGDAAGNLYVPDSAANRIRKIASDGTVTTIAGNGSAGFSGDGGLAVDASLYYPMAVAVDPAGNVYILDALSRVRRVSPDGIIRTIAGSGGALTGLPGDQFAGDSGPALLADLGLPISELGLAADASGAVYISETLNHRVRKVTPDGTISTFAGKGKDPADNIPALNAALSKPLGLAIDAAGNLYIADNGRGVRRVAPDGTISTVATLKDATAVAVDGAGNLYIASGQQVFQLTTAGVLAVIAGTGAAGYTGDGGLASQATLNFAYLNQSGTLVDGIALDPRGNLYIADGLNRRIRMVLASPPNVQPDIQSLAFAASANGAPALPQQITILGSIPLIGLELSVKTADGGDWLSISTPAGLTPLLVDVTADPSKLAPGTYQGTILIGAAYASPVERQVSVTFTVGPGRPARLTVDQDHLSFAFPQGSFTRNQALTIFNTGGGTLPFTATTAMDSGRQSNWLSISPASGTATAAAPVSLAVTANAAGLPAGTYSGRIVITSSNSPAPVTVLVALSVSAKPLSLLLSQSGLSFTAVADGGVVPPQTFGVLGIGSGVAPWTVEASALSGGNWLSVTPPSGTLASGAGAAPVVTVNVNQQGLAPGRYYGLIKTRAQGAANTPQVLTAFVDVQPKDTDLAAVIRPNELVFTAPAGESSPGIQEALVYNLTGSAKSFLSVPSVTGGDPLFFHVLPGDAIVQPGSPARIIIQPDLGVTGQSNSLPPGTHRGTLTLQFSDGRVRTLGITLIVTASPAATASSRGFSARADAVCVPDTLIPALSSLGTGFTVPAGWPLALQVDVRDNCGAALSSGAVTAEFSNGDPPLNLNPLANGRWEATWQTRSGQGAPVNITVKARSARGDISGAKQVSGGLGASQLPPVIAAGGVVNAANLSPQQPLAPGSAITILGDQLSDGQAAYSSLPAGTELAGTTVLIADQPAPLLMTNPQQINAIVPYGIEVNTTHQVLVQRGATYGFPMEITVAAAQPAIFTKSGTQGWIVDAKGALAGPGNAATAGDPVTIFCTGLGEVIPAVQTGSAGPALPGAATVNTVTATIGSVNARVTFAGLAPTLVGMYQVQAIVPDGVTHDDSVPVSLTVQSAPPQSSPVVTMAVR
jgi:uncharacterized protein (TIGR03437 family)